MKLLKPFFDLRLFATSKNNTLKFKMFTLKKYTNSAKPITLKFYQLNSPLFKKVLTDELIFLSNIFKKYNYELRIAGGAVRDLVMNILPHDIDLATNALPNEILEMFKTENIRIINNRGIKHGTVPVRINDKQNFEITTLRIDVKTYGRHAEVEFTNDWHKDAIRRDLTVNSLFLDFDGKIHDYVNGMEDIKNRIVRFVGTPDRRVKEDYLRILRYFRFYSKVRLDCNEHDKESLEAIKNNAEGLKMISGERIRNELSIILMQKFADSFIKLFYEFNLAPHMGLPKDGNLEKFCQVYETSSKNKMQPMSILSALLNNEQDVNNLNDRLKLSNDDRYLMFAIKKYENYLNQEQNEEKIIQYLTKEFLLNKAVIDRNFKKTEAVEIMKYLNKTKLIEKVNEIKIPVFNLNYNDLTQHTIIDESKQKPITIENYQTNDRHIRYKQILNDLKLKWIDSNYMLTKQDLLNLVDFKFLQNYVYLKKKKSK